MYAHKKHELTGGTLTTLRPSLACPRLQLFGSFDGGGVQAAGSNASIKNCIITDSGSDQRRKNSV